MFTARKSRPTSIAKGLPSHIVVKLGEKICRILCVLGATITEFQKQEPGALYEGTGEVEGEESQDDLSGQSSREIAYMEVGECYASILCQEAEGLRSSRSWADEVLSSTREEGMTLYPCYFRGTCTGAGGLFRCLRFLIAVKKASLW